jgi:hypothetical protein
MVWERKCYLYMKALHVFIVLMNCTRSFTVLLDTVEILLSERLPYEVHTGTSSGGVSVHQHRAIIDRLNIRCSNDVLRSSDAEEMTVF